jgi:hypothetical protein
MIRAAGIKLECEARDTRALSQPPKSATTGLTLGQTQVSASFRFAVQGGVSEFDTA